MPNKATLTKRIDVFLSTRSKSPKIRRVFTGRKKVSKHMDSQRIGTASAQPLDKHRSKSMVPVWFAPRAKVDVTVPIVEFFDEDDQPRLRSLATRFPMAHRVVEDHVRIAVLAVQRIAVDDEHTLDRMADQSVGDVRPTDAFHHKEQKAELAPLMGQMQLEGTPDSPIWLTVQEVEFHVDADNAEGEAFLLWHVGGPPKAIDFPALGQSYVMHEGDAIVFDGIHAHGARQIDQAGKPFTSTQADAPLTNPNDVTVFLATNVPFTESLFERMGIVTVEQTGEGGAAFDVDGLTGAVKTLVVAREVVPA